MVRLYRAGCGNLTVEKLCCIGKISAIECSVCMYCWDEQLFPLFSTRIHKFKSCSSATSSVPLHTMLWNFLPGSKTSYLGMKLLTWVWNFLRGYETSYLGMKLLTWVWNFLRGYETSYVGMNFFYQSLKLLYLILKLVRKSNGKVHRAASPISAENFYRILWQNFVKFLVMSARISFKCVKIGKNRVW
jgi:hypothetical protein